MFRDPGTRQKPETNRDPMSSILYIALKGIPVTVTAITFSTCVHFVEPEFFAHLGIRSKDHTVRTTSCQSLAKGTCHFVEGPSFCVSV